MKRQRGNYFKYDLMITFFIFTLVWFMQLSIFATSSHNMSISQVKITYARKESGIMKGSFILSNDADYPYKNIFQATELYLDYTETKSNLMNQSVTAIRIGRNESKEMEFRHPIEPRLPEGKYSFMIRIYASSGEVLAVYHMYVGLLHPGGSSGILVCDVANASFDNAREHAGALDGAVFPSDTKPLLNLLVQNIGQEKISAAAHIAIYKSCFTDQMAPLISQLQDYEIEFLPGKQTALQLQLPKMPLADSYQAIITFVHGGKPISGKIESRFVIAGVNAGIYRTTAQYKSNQLIVRSELRGPADGTTLKGLNQNVIILDHHNKEIARQSRVAEVGKQLVKQEFTFPIPIDSRQSFRIVQELYYMGCRMDSCSSDYGVDELVHMSDKNLLAGKVQASENLELTRSNELVQVQSVPELQNFEIDSKMIWGKKTFLKKAAEAVFAFAILIFGFYLAGKSYNARTRKMVFVAARAVGVLGICALLVVGSFASAIGSSSAPTDTMLQKANIAQGFSSEHEVQNFADLSRLAVNWPDGAGSCAQSPSEKPIWEGEKIQICANFLSFPYNNGLDDRTEMINIQERALNARTHGTMKLVKRVDVAKQIILFTAWVPNLESSGASFAVEMKVENLSGDKMDGKTKLQEVRWIYIEKKETFSNEPSRRKTNV